MGKPAWRRGTYATKPANCWAGNGSLTAAGRLATAREISGESLTLTAQQVDNAQGKMVAVQDANLTSQQGLNNTAGWLEAGNTLSVKTNGDWNNQGGTAQGGRQITATAQTLDNTGGRLQSGGDLGLDTVGNILNRTGKLTAQQALDIRGGDTGLFDNDGGSLQSGGDLSLQGGQLTNRAAGVVLGGRALSDADGGWDNQNGTLTGNSRTQVRAASLLNARGAINALGSPTCSSATGWIMGRGVFSARCLKRSGAGHLQRAGWMGSRELAGHKQRF